MNPIIYEASATGLFRVILIVLIVYALYSFLIRFVIPSMMKKYITDFQNRFTEQNQQPRNEKDKKKEGEVSITYVDKAKKTAQHPDAGEYIDYEEVQ